MSTAFPTTLETRSTQPAVGALGEHNRYSALIENMRDANIAMQAKIGIDSSGVSGTLDDMALQGVRYQDTQLTAAQVNALLTTNITVVTAPAAGKARFPVLVQLFNEFGAAAWVQDAVTDHLALKYAASTEIEELGSQTQCTTLLHATDDSPLIVPIGLGTLGDGLVPVAAKAIVLDNNGATAYTTGTGNTLSVRVWFVEFPMASFS